MLTNIKATYQEHNLCSFEQSLDPEHYFVVRDGGEIVAGAQLSVVRWQALQLQGWQGRLVLNLLPHIPVLSRRFTPANLRFARAGNLYAKPGSEHLVAEILETALAKLRLPFAAIFLDGRGAPERRILEKTKLGAMDRAIKGGFHLMSYFKGMSDQDITSVLHRPVIISPRDPI